MKRKKPTSGPFVLIRENKNSDIPIVTIVENLTEQHKLDFLENNIQSIIDVGQLKYSTVGEVSPGWSLYDDYGDLVAFDWDRWGLVMKSIPIEE